MDKETRDEGKSGWVGILTPVLTKNEHDRAPGGKTNKKNAYGPPVKDRRTKGDEARTSKGLQKATKTTKRAEVLTSSWGSTREKKRGFYIWRCRA